MDRRRFLKNSVALAATTAFTEGVHAAQPTKENAKNTPKDSSKLIISAPMLQNYAPTSMGVAFAVSAMANGFVRYSTKEDLSDAKTVKCGGFRVTDMNDKVMQVRLTGLREATTYYYQIGADRIQYDGGYAMKNLGQEVDPTIYSFTTAGFKAREHFCVINDTHAHMAEFSRTIDKVEALAPSCVIWNGDATNVEESIDSQIGIFLKPDIQKKDYAARRPYLFCPGNHDNRGMANRHIERVWMYRQPEERSSRDWDLGRNFAIRMGDVALIGLDTAEDKVDTNPLFAGLFTSGPYREAQAIWLRDALEREEIASAPFIVTLCHIPLFSSDPTHNPGDVFPEDKDPQYSAGFAYWQRTCAQLWAPLLEKARCQVVITAHMHAYRYDEPTKDRTWGHLVGGGWDLKSESGYPTVIEGKVENGKLRIRVHNVASGQIIKELTFDPRQ